MGFKKDQTIILKAEMSQHKKVELQVQILHFSEAPVFSFQI